MMKRMQSEARKAARTVVRKTTAGRSAYVMDGRGFVHVEQIKHKGNTDFFYVLNVLHGHSKEDLQQVQEFRRREAYHVQSI